jgi:ABC-2 type transport system ATP-binding protein
MIEARNLTKIFGQKLAVSDVSFTVERGEVLGFLGPNAAGKSTTMRMITGFLPPSSGTAVLGGDDIVEQSLSARRRIGYLPENAPAYPDMTVQGFLGFIAEIRGFSGLPKTRRVQETLERCFLSDVRYQPIHTLSKGYRQRVCFAQSILHDPEYLIMDEPTDGLDPNQKHEVREMIRQMSRKKAILLSTHNLEEVGAVCTRVIVIARGRIVLDDTPEGMQARSTIHGAITFKIKGGEEHGSRILETVEAIPGVGKAELLAHVGVRMEVRVHPQGDSAMVADRVVRHFLEQGTPLEGLFVEHGRLDEVFRMVTTTESER